MHFVKFIQSVQSVFESNKNLLATSIIEDGELIRCSFINYINIIKSDVIFHSSRFTTQLQCVSQI